MYYKFKFIKPLSKAQIERLYTSSPKIHADVSSKAAFTRLLKLVESVHCIDIEFYNFCVELQKYNNTKDEYKQKLIKFIQES